MTGAIRGMSDIVKSFEGLEFAPGSKQRRRDDTPEAEKRRKRALGESNGWDAEPVMRTLRGQPTEFFTIGALAHALEKEIVTIRLWERKGYIPTAPFRFRSKKLNGQTVAGNRAYTRAQIEAAIEEFGIRGLIGAPRVDWKKFSDLPQALAQRWKATID